MWIFPHSTKTGLFIRCLFQCNSRFKPHHLNSQADYYVSHGIWSLLLQCSDDQSLLYSCIHLSTSHEVMKLQLFSGRPKSTKDVRFTGYAVVFPPCIILGKLVFKHLWCTCFWIWWKLMGVCGPLLHECVNIPHYLIPEPMWFSSKACWSPLCRCRYRNWIQYPTLNSARMNAEGHV